MQEKNTREVRRYDGGKNRTKGNRKTERMFGGGGYSLIDLLKKIDALPSEVGLELRRIVCINGKYGTLVEKRRSKEIEELIQRGYLRDITSNKAVLKEKYTKDKLFMELSKKQYDIKLNSQTTKTEMIEYILGNEKATKRLAGKYITAAYTDEFKQQARELYEFIDRLNSAHPYMTQDHLLVDFYYEIKGEKAERSREIDNVVDSIISISNNRTEKKPSFFSRLFKIQEG